MVQIDQVANMMDQMMNMDILQSSEKLQMLEDAEMKFLDPNIIMDTRHRIFRENLTAAPTNGSVRMGTKKLLTHEEATQLYMKKQQRFLERELKKFEMELSKARPKFLKPYTCSRQNLAPSNDDDFWRTSRKVKSKAIVGERKIQGALRERSGDSCLKSEITETDVSLLKVKDEKCLKTTICEVPYVGSIKVTFKEKTNIDTDTERLRILKKCLDILKRNVVEKRRLREIKMKIQVNMISKIMRKYFNIWRTRTKDAKDRKKKRAEEISEEGRIELFIKAITERQRELMKSQKTRSRDENLQKVKELSNANTEKEITCPKRIIVEPPAQCRLSAQKKIIEKQKAKLAEQNRIIEELKLKQMQEDIFRASKETIDTAKETLTHCGQKTRRTLIQLMHQNGYRDENLIVHRRVPDPPKFLYRMEARAEARRKRVKLVEELRRHKHEEQKKKEDAARVEEEQKKRRAQQEALAEARKLQKAQEENRRREREKFQRLNSTADAFYRKFLLRHYIMEPFVRLIEQKRINIKIAEDHYREKLSKKMFTTWKAEANTQSNRKSAIASSFYNKNLMTEMLEQWKKMTKETKSKYQVAIDFYDMKLMDKYIKLWIVRVVESKEEFEEKAKLADSTYKNKLKNKCFGIWKKYVAIADDIKDSERRKDQLRQLVQKVIPDFNPKQRGVILEY